MSATNERSRPAGNGPANESLDNDDTSISPRDATVAQIMALGADAILPASLGYYLGRLDAEDRVERTRAQAGFDVANSPEWHRVIRQPRYAELRRRRGEAR